MHSFTRLLACAIAGGAQCSVVAQAQDAASDGALADVPAGATAAGPARPGAGMPAASGLEEIVTVSSRIDRPRRELGTAVSVLTATDLEAQGYVSVMDALRTLPSVGVSNAGGPGKVSSLRIRGEDGFRTLVRIDGIAVSDPSATQVAPSIEHLVATREIDRIEVLRGPQGFIYGADAGGVVDIRSRRPVSGVETRLGVELGAYGTRRLDAGLGAGGDRGDLLVSIADVATDGFNSLAADVQPADADGYDNRTVHTKLGWNAADDMRVELVARDSAAGFEFDRCGFPTTNDCRGTTDQAAYGLSLELGSRRRLGHRLALTGTETSRRNFADDVEAFATRGNLRRFEYLGTAAVSDATNLVYGVELADESVAPTGAQRLERTQRAYYVEYETALGERIFVTAGARRDASQDFGRHDSARVSAAYLKPLSGGATLKYRASVGTGFRAPSLSELAYNAGPFSYPPAAGLTLIEESSRGADVGIELATAGGGYYEATVFDQTIENEIFFDLVAFSGYLQAPGISRSRGLELVARIPIGERFLLLGNATFNDTDTVDDLVRIRRPRRMANLGMRMTAMAERLRLQANYRLAADAEDELFGIGRLPLEDYAVLDLSLSYAMPEHIELFGRIQNLLDTAYEEVVGFNTSGAAVYAGVRLRF